MVPSHAVPCVFSGVWSVEWLGFPLNPLKNVNLLLPRDLKTDSPGVQLNWSDPCVRCAKSPVVENVHMPPGRGG